MEKLKFDSGVRAYDLGCGVLRFNPSDPNLFGRFLDAAEEIRDIEKELLEKANAAENADDGKLTVQLLVEADRKMKALLQKVFGQVNDFDKILGGVNLLAVAGNGERVITNLFAALEPVLVDGAQSCAAGTAAQALSKAKKRREQTER